MPINKVVYTAITGNYDSLKLNQEAKDVDYVAFLEDPKVSNIGVWEIRDMNEYLPSEYKDFDNNRRSKWFKLHPHKLFGKKYKYSVWIDGSVETKKDLGELVDGARWRVFPHFARKSIKEEANACLACGRDKPELMLKQVAYYTFNQGYLDNHGLAENTIIIRNHNDRRVKGVNGKWWNEILMWSKRDQLSFDYSCWVMKFKYERLKGTVYQNDWFKVYAHEN